MDQLTETTRRVVEILMRDWILWVAILGVVLAFALYIYFNPRSMEFFTGSKAPVHEKEQPKEADIEAAAQKRGATPQPTA
jgi:hypothetical protein